MTESESRRLAGTSHALSAQSKPRRLHTTQAPGVLRAPGASQAPFQARQVSTSCAICANEIRGEVIRQPLGRGDALVPVCTACDTGAITARSSQLGYTGYETPIARIARRPAASAKSTVSPAWSSSPAAKARTPGFVLHRVSMRHRDEDEARATFAGEPWAAEARYLSTSAGWHLFEHPPTIRAVPEQPLAGIEQWRVRS